MRRFAPAFPFAVATLVVACRSTPAPPPAPPQPLSDSAAAAVRWVDAHASSFTAFDSIPLTSDELRRLGTLIGDAKVIGFSELTQATQQFPSFLRRALPALAESNGVRGIAIQGPMPEAMDLDRYVRTGVGDPRRLLRTLNSWHWDTRELLALVTSLKEWNASHADKQIGFYGFEIPTGAHALEVIATLRDSVTGPALGAYLRRQFACVASDEAAHWGLEGRASDSTFWISCRPSVTAATESIAVLRARLGPSSRHAADLEHVEKMARLIQHHVTIGLRHMTRHEGNAEHVLFLANSLGAAGKLVLWGGDVEMGRLTLQPNNTQTGEVLGTRLGARYRAIGFLVGDGTLENHRPNTGRGGGGQPGGLTNIPIRPPGHELLEDIFRRASADAFWIDFRDLPNDNAGTWLRGPRQSRLISDVYAPEAELQQLFLNPLELPKFFDAILFVKRVTAARPL